MSRSGWAWLAIAVVVALTSWFARDSVHRRFHLPDRDGWVTADPDSHHLMRRVERIFRDGLPPPQTDPMLDGGRGAAYPTAPYYPLFVWSVLAPFAPSDADARREWLEMRMASLPLVLGVLTSLVAAWLGRELAGPLAGLGAGLYHALCPASIGYSNSGNGDYHAWITLLVQLALLVLTAALARGALERRRSALLAGAAIGATVGLALGSWTATLIHVAELELVLAWLLFLNARRPIAHLATFGLALHLTALAVLAPAVISSPWTQARPWMVVNLSWFHLAFLACGALVFAPLPTLARRPRAARLYPWMLAAGFVAIGAALLLGDPARASSLGEAFAWLSGRDEFMASVRESQPLLGPRAALDADAYLGLGLYALPLAWLLIAWRAARERELAFAPLTVIVPIASLCAAAQLRFADALVVPLAASVAWLVFGAGRGAKLVQLVPRAAVAAIGLAALVAANVEGLSSALRMRSEDASEPRDREGAARRGARELCEWLRARDASGDAVLAPWTFGHTILWSAWRPAVSDNFGMYLGERNYRDAARFLLTSSADRDRALALLAERNARFVLVPSDLASFFETFCAIVEGGGTRLERDPRDPRVHAASAWLESLGARLLFDGRAPPGAKDLRVLDSMRLVAVASVRDPRRRLRSADEPSPSAFLWERVPGAVVEARGSDGERLDVRLTIRFARASYALTFENASPAIGGVARVRVPYCTTEPNGDGVVDKAEWSFGDRRGALSIEPRAIALGETIEIR